MIRSVWFCNPGTKSAGALRAKLRDAIRRADPDAITRVIDECVASGMPELDAEVQRARRILEGRKEELGGRQTKLLQPNEFEN